MHRSVRALATAAALVGVALALLVGLDGWPGPSAVGLGDCELVGAGIAAQPVAAWTSLAFVPAGMWVAGHRLARVPIAAVFAAGFVAVGLASFAGHASATAWGRDLDSYAIKAMLVPFILYPIARARSWPDRAFVAASLAAAALLVAAEVVVPAAGRPILAAMAGTLLIVLLRTTPIPMLAPGIGMLALGAAAWWLGRTGGALCRADTLLQLHGAWHIIAAGGLAVLYRGMHDY